MYAVFVIAAILLSVAPGHARMLLSALPSRAPGHQVVPDDATERLPVAAGVRTSLSAAPGSYAIQSVPAVAVVPAAVQAATLAPSNASILEHAPNAP